MIAPKGSGGEQGKKIDTDLIGDDAALRAALRAVNVPRNIDLDGKWYPRW